MAAPIFVPNQNLPLGFEDSIKLIRVTLADICVQAKLDDVSPWRFLNRASLLFQNPLCFVVFRSCETGYILDRVDRKTMRDPLYHGEFADALARIGVADKPGASVPRDCLDSYIIPLFDTEFYIVAFRVQGGHHVPCGLQEVSYIPIPGEHPIGTALRAVFAPFGRVLQEMRIQEHLKKRFGELFSADAYIKAKHDNPCNFPIDENGPKIVQKYYKDLTRNVLDEEIGRVLPSPAISQSGISRFLLFIKVFDRCDVRFGHYFYDIKVHISPDQRKQIKDRLTSSTMDGLTSFCDSCAAAWVRQRVDLGRHDEIFALLETPLSRSARLFCEHTLLSGAAILNVDPFLRGDIGWYSGNPKGDDYKHEMRRFASIHYILLSMASDLVRPAILTIPIRVDGATWMSVTTVVRTDNNHNGIVNGDEVERRFLFYHSIMRDFETHIRRKSKQRYLWAVSQILSKKVNYLRKTSEPSRVTHAGPARARGLACDPSDPEQPLPIGGDLELQPEDYAALARDLLNLCRLYPYKPILFGPQGAAKRYGWNEVDLHGIYHEDCGIGEQNPYFDRMQMREFLSRDQISSRVREVMNSEIGLQELKKQHFGIASAKMS